MLTAALQGLAVHVTPSLPATVQYTTGGHPEWQTNFTEALSRLWQPRSPDGDVLTVFVEVGKTASTTVHKTFRDTIEATGSFCIIDFANDPKPCFGSAIVFGVPFGACSALAPGSRCQYLTTLREPGNRTVSEYNYFCRACSEGGKLCNANTGCPKTSFMQWARDHSEQFTQHFSPPLWPPTVQWMEHQDAEHTAYYYQYAHGFPDRPTVNDRDYERALSVLSGDGPMPMLTIKTEELDVDGWERIEEYVGAPGLDLRSHEEVVLHGRPKGGDYEPTEEELKEVREVIDAYDSRLYQAIPSHGSVPGPAR